MLTLETVSCLETVLRQFFFCLGRGLQFVVLVVIATVIKKTDSVITLFETMQTDKLLSMLFTNFVFSSSVNLNIHNNISGSGRLLPVKDFIRSPCIFPGNVLSWSRMALSC